MLLDYSPGQLISGMVAFFIYIYICELFASAAQKNNVNYWKTFFICVIATPILGALYVLVEKK